MISHYQWVTIPQARLQQYVNREIPDVQAEFRKGRGTRDQIASICWIIEKAKEFQKNNYFALLTMSKPFTVWITINCGKFLKRWEYQITWPASWEICRQVKKQQLELDMEQQIGSKSGKEYDKAECHPAYLTYMKNTSWEMLGWMKHKLESRLPGEIPIISDRQMTPPYGRKWRRTKKPLDESERVEWKSWLKAQHSENEDHGIRSHHFMVHIWGNSGNSVRLYFFILQNHCRWWLQP